MTGDEQLALAVHAGPKPGSTIEHDFRDFHAQNPEVYDRLVELARQWKLRRGNAKLGIKMLWEVLRWETALHTRGDDFRLNNNFTSYYARLIMEREPDLEGVFELRRLHTPRPYGSADQGQQAA